MNDGRRVSGAAQTLKEDADMIDIFNCVERVYPDVRISGKVGATKYLLIDKNNPQMKVPLNTLFLALPRHIMGCLISKQPKNPPDQDTHRFTTATIDSTSHFEHIAKAFSVLGKLVRYCLNPVGISTVQDAENLFGPSSEFTTQLIDAVIFTLLAITGPEATLTIESAASVENIQQAVARAAAVSAALEAFVFYMSGPEEVSALSDVEYESLIEAIFTHPRGGLFPDAAFDALCVLVSAIRASLCSGSASTASDKFSRLAYCTGGSMDVLFYLSAEPLFYHRMMLGDPYGEASLRLILECMCMHDEPLTCPPFKRVIKEGGGSRPVLAATLPPYSTDSGAGAAELIAARGFALLVLLGEHEAPSYIDEIFKSPNPKALAMTIVGKAATYVGQVLLRPRPKDFPVAKGEPQMAINVLRAAEFMSDDSNFRGPLIKGLAPTLAQLLLNRDEAAFMSIWGAGEEAIRYHAHDDILLNSVTEDSMRVVEKYAAASRAYFSSNQFKQPPQAKKLEGLSGTEMRLGRHLAIERAVLLSKLFINLHHWDEKSGADAKDQFVDGLVSALKRDKSPEGIVIAAKNLGRLLDFAQEFAAPKAKPEHVLMSEIDTELSKDLLDKVRAAAGFQLHRPQLAVLPQQQDVYMTDSFGHQRGAVLGGRVQHYQPAAGGVFQGLQAPSPPQ